MVVMMALGLLDLCKGLLGAGEITGLQRLGQGCERALRAVRLGILWRRLGRECLKGGKSFLGTSEVAGLQGLAELVKQALPLSPLGLLSLLGRIDSRRYAQIGPVASMRAEGEQGSIPAPSGVHQVSAT
ncbi:MAG TPA: hypothetical protein VF378_10465 [Geothrix sp.]